MSQDPSTTIRPLRADDLDRVVAIDEKTLGRSRRAFYEKRLNTALTFPDSFIVVAAETDGELSGFGIARIQTGEFGEAGSAAVLDILGVDPDARHHGIGHQVLAAIEDVMRRKDIHELRTQADWGATEMAGFMASVGFEMAPMVIMERGTDRRDF
ncbi:MAG: GNAT family N-acetyltransferase [Hyphomicrobiales bacterium]|nr:GNAT family N-acetyltransferase [Hyphomicrobiales bacterium]MCP5374319.1 GNAT family N-acetyltransferase [Hyphomicrobiales bacterium]